jgi:hypothetical protein
MTSGGFEHLAGLDATSAGTDALYFSVNFGAHILKVWQKPSGRQVVGMTLVVPCARFLSANITYSRHIWRPIS